MKDLIEQQVAEQVQQHLESMNGQVQQLQSQASESIQQLAQVADRIQDQRAAAQIALDSLSTAMKNQMIASPDLLRPGMTHGLLSNKAYHAASCYYEAMLRYWTNNGLVYSLSTQVNMVSHAIALEINRATFEMSIAAHDARNAWHDFKVAVNDSIVIDGDMLDPVWDERGFGLTFVFTDGLVITAAVQEVYDINVGGLPPGTFVYVNGLAFEIVENGYYMVKCDIHGFQRTTTLLNDSMRRI